MTLEQFLILMIMPVGAIVAALFALYLVNRNAHKYDKNPDGRAR